MPNFADPNYEPTDEDLRALSREAFAGVAARNQTALERLHQEIAAMSKQILADLARREAGER